jgi:negative regulator of genetic competence, sporulation and motility
VVTVTKKKVEPETNDDQFSAFEDMARRLVNVPKSEIDKRRAEEEAAKPSR